MNRRKKPSNHENVFYHIIAWLTAKLPPEMRLPKIVHPLFLYNIAYVRLKLSPLLRYLYSDCGLRGRNAM